jgi:hypothetical protein
MSYVIKNMGIFILNSDIHNIHTTHGSELRHPTYKLAKIQKGVYHSRLTIFNNLQQNVKDFSSDASKLKHTLRKFLHIGSFYSLGEYFDWRTREDMGSYK